jgi:hypothetical protein
VTGDILMSGETNVKKLPYEGINEILLDSEHSVAIDLEYTRSDNFMTANNLLTHLGDPSVEFPEGMDNIEIRRLSGIDTSPHNRKLNLSFTDMVMRQLGYIVQERNPYAKRLFAQILHNDHSPDGNTDRNLDIPAVHAKNSADLGEGWATWLLPFVSTKVWAYPIESAPNVQDFKVAKFPPNHVSPDITDYSVNNGQHKRELSTNPTTCYADPNDQYVCPPSSSCICGQDHAWRECAGDVLSHAQVGLPGRHFSEYGCGLWTPYAENDPFVGGITTSSSSSGGGKVGDESSYICHGGEC